MKKKLVSLMEQIEEGVSEINKLEGRKEEITEQLINQYGLRDIKEAENFVEKSKTNLNNLREEIERKYDEIIKQVKEIRV